MGQKQQAKKALAGERGPRQKTMMEMWVAHAASAAASPSSNPPPTASSTPPTISQPIGVHQSAVKTSSLVQEVDQPLSNRPNPRPNTHPSFAHLKQDVGSSSSFAIIIFLERSHALPSVVFGHSHPLSNLLRPATRGIFSSGSSSSRPTKACCQEALNDISLPVEFSMFAVWEDYKPPNLPLASLLSRGMNVKSA